MAIVRILENNTKVLQVYYDRNGDRIELKPGQRHVETISGNVNPDELSELSRLEADVEEKKRIKTKLALIRVSQSIEELDKFKEHEMSDQVMSAILERQRELLKKETPDGGLFNYR
jgi:hypothetical protein